MLGIIEKIEMDDDDDVDGYDGITAVSRRLRWTKAGHEGFPVLGLLGAEV